MTLHRQMIDQALGALDAERVDYFMKIVEALEEDPRIEAVSGPVYLILKECLSLLPTYMGRDAFIDALFAFERSHHNTLKKYLYDEAFVLNPESIREVTDKFVEQIVADTMKLYEAGEIAEDRQTEQKFTFPYRAEDLADPDDEDEQEEARAKQEAYMGPERRKR